MPQPSGRLCLGQAPLRRAAAPSPSATARRCPARPSRRSSGNTSAPGRPSRPSDRRIPLPGEAGLAVPCEPRAQSSARVWTPEPFRFDAPPPGSGRNRRAGSLENRCGGPHRVKSGHAASRCSNSTASSISSCGTSYQRATSATEPVAVAALASTSVGTPCRATIGRPKFRVGSSTTERCSPSGHRRTSPLPSANFQSLQERPDMRLLTWQRRCVKQNGA